MQLNIVTFALCQKKDKLITRFKKLPKDFHYDEMVRLLSYYGFEEVKKGKTAGSRVKFVNEENIPSFYINHNRMGADVCSCLNQIA